MTDDTLLDGSEAIDYLHNIWSDNTIDEYGKAYARIREPWFVVGRAGSMAVFISLVDETVVAARGIGHPRDLADGYQPDRELTEAEAAALDRVIGGPVFGGFEPMDGYFRYGFRGEDMSDGDGSRPEYKQHDLEIGLGSDRLSIDGESVR